MARGVAHRPLSAAPRVLALLAGALSLGVAGIALGGLLSALYSSLAYDFLRRPLGLEAAQQAADYAVALAPWRGEGYKRQAEVRLRQRDHDGAVEAALRRLRWTPADAYAWQQRAMLYRRAGHFDAGLLAAYDMARRRAPQAAMLDLMIALDGVHDWRFGDAELRRVWLEATRRTLPRRRHRTLFATEILRHHRETAFCAYATPHIPELESWCDGVRQYRRACSAAGLTRQQVAWCRRIGFEAGDWFGH